MNDEIVLEVDDPAVHALLPKYLKRRADDIAAMREALCSEGWDHIAMVAHRMRGSGAAYGMPFVTQIGRQLERAAQAADAGVIGEALDQLDAYLGRVRVS